MPNKHFILLVVLTLFSKAHADSYVNNLKDLSFDDMCPIGVYVTVDEQDSKEDVSRLTKILSDQDILYDTRFTRSPYEKCKVNSYISIDALKTSSGSYVYSSQLVLSASDAKINLFDRITPVRFVSFYDTGSFGISSSLPNFKAKLDDIVKSLFQDLVLSWRKAH